jgi:hypothetical protein
LTLHRLKPAVMEPSAKFKNAPQNFNEKDISGFWQWAFSDLLQNTTRGILAEYIVAVLLGVDEAPRNPWESFDLRLHNGKRIEVKTMSYLQAWTQKALSVPRVVLSPKRFWDPDTNVMEKRTSLNSDLYIICHFTAKQHTTANALDLDQWRFYVLEKNKVEDILKKAKSVTIENLRNMGVRALEAAELAPEIQRLNLVGQ